MEESGGDRGRGADRGGECGECGGEGSVVGKGSVVGRSEGVRVDSLLIEVGECGWGGESVAGWRECVLRERCGGRREYTGKEDVILEGGEEEAEGARSREGSEPDRSVGSEGVEEQGARRSEEVEENESEGECVERTYQRGEGLGGERGSIVGSGSEREEAASEGMSANVTKAAAAAKAADVSLAALMARTPDAEAGDSGAAQDVAGGAAEPCGAVRNCECVVLGGMV
ncbi:unnamed protein product, partial [Closterium sp. NIES-64]